MFIRLLYYGFRAYCFFFRPVRMGVRVLMIQNKKACLVRQTYMPGWYMPGGGLNRNETLEDAARREAKEETGAELGKMVLLGAYSSFGEWKSDHNVVFVCEDFKMIGKPDAEIAEMKFFSLDELPEGLMPGHRRRIEEYISGLNIPQFGEW